MAGTYLSKKAFRTLEVMKELGTDNLCTSNQAEIAELTGYSVRHQRRAIRELEKKGFIDTISRRVANGKRNIYRLKSYPQEPDKKSPHPPQGTGQKESAPPGGSGQKESDSIGQKESAPPRLMIHDDDHEKKKEENDQNLWITQIKSLLEWVDEPTRSYLAELNHMTPDYARRMTEFFYQGIYPAKIKDPAAYLISLMQRGHPPPAVQRELPAGKLRIDPQIKDLMDQNPPIEGMTWNGETWQ